MAGCNVFFLVCLAVVLSGAVCCHSVDCDEKDEDKNENNGDAPIIEIRAIEKTDERIELEIISSILIETAWYSDMFVKVDSDYNYAVSVLPMRDEPGVSTWEHTRLEGDSTFITTAGIAKLDQEVNTTSRQIELQITAVQNNIGVTLRSSWGAEVVDASLIPVLQAVPPSVINFEEGEEVRATLEVKGNDVDVMVGFNNISESQPIEGVTLYSNRWDVEDEKKGVKAYTQGGKSQQDGRNTTEVVLEIKDTTLESNWGMYDCFLSLHGGSTMYIFVTFTVLPRSVRSIVPEGQVWLHAYTNGRQREEPIVGIRYGYPCFIRCVGIGFPVDDMTILRPSLESVLLETHNGIDFSAVDLYIKSAKASDEGTYTCVASSNDRVFKHEIVVMRTVKTEVEFDIISQTDDEVVLMCRARGQPLPTLTIKRQDSESYILTTVEDGGIYDIQVDVDNEEEEITALLKVSETSDNFGDSYNCVAENLFSEETVWLHVEPN